MATFARASLISDYFDTDSVEILGFIGFFHEARRVYKNLLAFFSTPVAEANRASYDSPAVVEAYANRFGLSKPEQTIFNLLKAKPRFRRMLDIGVGGGRTTRPFSELAEEYVGIDYSENMIKVCREKFLNGPKVSFAIVDARNLEVYPDNYFDFALFSHGGLDAVAHEDRMRILREIRRVVKPAGYFCFSTSNLDAMLQFCRIGLPATPRAFANELYALLLTRLLNSEMWKHVRGKRSSLEHTMFIMGRRGKWNLKTYCITLEAQVKQLRDLGFGEIRVYDLQGKEISHAPNRDDVELYFLARKTVPG